MDAYCIGSSWNSFMHMLSFAQWCVAYFLLQNDSGMQESTKFLCNHNCDDILHCFGILMIWYQLLANQKCTHYAVPMFLAVWHWHLRLNLQVSPLKSYAGEGGCMNTSLFMLESSDVDWWLWEITKGLVVSWFRSSICWFVRFGRVGGWKDHQHTMPPILEWRAVKR